MNKRAWEQAYSAGRFARQAARGRDSCPMYGITPDAAELRDRWRDRWREGWDDEDRARKKGQAK